ncbi:hypothetical protein BDW22DRAFT_1360301 [Trametopsis cervina]|nr:hypothetical protein BDW22DRAFT_1360301 [Trametopsis cervina]
MLPTEIIDMIIDHLYEDRSTLMQCALVSYTWSVSARFHLFQAIVVTLPDADKAADDGLDSVLHSFRSPMGSQCTSYVRKLTIQPRAAIGYWNGRTEPSLELGVLGQLLNLLSRLETLSIMDVSWAALPDVLPVSSTSSSVRSLSVRRIVSPIDPKISEQPYKTIRDGLDILKLLPALKLLRTTASPWGPSGLRQQASTAETPFPNDLRLEALGLWTEGPACVFIEYALPRLNLSCLTSLSIWWFYVEDIPAIGRLIKATAHSLKRLELRLNNMIILDLEGEPEPEDLSPQLNLDQCSQLESLSLFVPVDLHTTVDCIPHWDFANAVLANLPLCVREISLGLDNHPHVDDQLDELDEVEWEDQIRAFQRLPALETVTFSGGSRGSSALYPLDPQVEELISMYLAVLLPRGIIRFYPKG